MTITSLMKSAGIELFDYFNAFFDIEDNELMTQKENHYYDFI